eukprot:TRINITY_DN18188_c0_g1_i3.p1 TRINITY_DN18188_c0_g1~~TRINITY_DN18188_c0_g1_i3.p1  ORF type:complete len:152 (+),score=45.93 TRINITY_DN18188_c0_g1_i3:108-563(+)
MCIRDRSTGVWVSIDMDVNCKTFALGVTGGLVGAALFTAAKNTLCKPNIVRLRTKDARASGIVIRDGVVSISGQVGDLDKLDTSDITLQTQQTLAKIVALLEEAGSSKSQILEARIWVKDIAVHFAPMNEVWNAWVDPGLLVEIQVIAAQI